MGKIKEAEDIYLIAQLNAEDNYKLAEKRGDKLPQKNSDL